MAYFDEKGDLWIEVTTSANIPLVVQVGATQVSGPVSGQPGVYSAVTCINLTRYIADMIAEKTGAS